MLKKYLLLLGVCLIWIGAFPQDALILKESKGEKTLMKALKTTASYTISGLNEKSSQSVSALYYVDYNLTTDQMHQALNGLSAGSTITVATSASDFANQIATNLFDLGIIFVQNESSTTFESAILALSHFVNEEGGRGIYFDYSRDNTYGSLFGVQYTGNINNMTVTILPPLNENLTENPFTLSNPGWATPSVGLIAINDGKVLATFSNGEAAIVSGLGGRMLVYGFKNDEVSISDIFTAGINHVLNEKPEDVFLCDYNVSEEFVCANDSAKIYKWRLSTDSVNFEDIPEGGIYSGVTNDTLKISNVDETMVGYQYQCIGYWGLNKSDTSRTATIKEESTLPAWKLNKKYTIYSCNGIDAELSLPLPTDNCHIDSIAHNSPFGVSKTNPSGTYPVDTTTVVYYVKDSHDNILIDSFDVVVLPETDLPSWDAYKISTYIPSVTYFSSTTTGKQTFSDLSGGVLTGRPYYNGTCCGANPPVEMVKFVPVEDGNVTIETTASWDCYSLLYTDPHSLNVSPPVTFVAGNDDGGSGSIFSATLKGGQNYYLYTTGYSETSSGNYSVTFSAPVKITTKITDTTFVETCDTEADIAFPSPMDTCGLDSIHFDSPYGTSTNPDGTYPLGLTKIHYYLRDLVGNEVTDSIIIKVMKDATPSDWIKDTLVVICGDSTYISFPEPFDNCGIDSIYSDSPYGISETDPSGTYPLGTTTIGFYVKDVNGNILNDYANIVVINDTTLPVWNIKDTLITICGDSVYITFPEPEDNCGIDSIYHSSLYGINAKNPSGYYPMDTTLIKYFVSDIYGNTLIDSAVIVIIHDTTSPSWDISDTTVFTCNDSANIIFNLPFDECKVDSIIHDSPYSSTTDISGTYPTGKTVVHFSVYDTYKNALIDSITITVKEDSIAPVIACFKNSTKGITSDLTSYTVQGDEFDPDVTDECSTTLKNNFNSSGTLAGSELPIGTTSITWTAEDLAGNTQSCSFNVIVNYLVSTSSSAFTEISVFPNPSKGNFTINTPQNSHIVILDITGKIIFEKQLYIGDNNIDLDGKGIYQLKIITPDNTFIRKVIIE